MGLDAYVYCNCIKEGKAAELPFDWNFLKFEDGYYFLKREYEEQYAEQFILWQETACEHEDFYYINTRVANVSGWNLLESILNRLGKRYYPYLSTMGEKEITPIEAQEALRELNHFCTKMTDLNVDCIVDSQTGQNYRIVLEGEQVDFFYSGTEYTYSLNPTGFCITDSQENVLFRSLSFKQEVKHLAESERIKPIVTFTDMDTGKHFVSRSAFERLKNWETREFYYPSELKVVRRKLKTSDLICTSELRELYKASILNNNSVYWS